MIYADVINSQKEIYVDESKNDLLKSIIYCLLYTGRLSKSMVCMKGGVLVQFF